jgi:hypothetical protein
MDGVATTNGSSSHDALTPEVTTSVSIAFEPEVFRSYLLALPPPVTGANPVALQSLLGDESNARVIRFASGVGGAVYMIKVEEDSDSGM